MMQTEHDNAGHKCDNLNSDCKGAISYSPKLGWLCGHHAYQAFLVMRNRDTPKGKLRNVALDISPEQLDMFGGDDG